MTDPNILKNGTRGQVMVGAILLLMVLLITVPLLVKWSDNEARWSVKEQKSTTAFNLAEAGVDRGMWKLKSSTSTWTNALAGAVPAGYDFNTTYKDIPGGTYRINIAPDPDPATDYVVITAEGRDNLTRETRAVQAVYENLTFQGAIITGGVLAYAGAFEAHWGPVLAHNDINISGNAATEYFPRKFSKQVVRGTSGQPRDNNINPPNTDNVEWWSDYQVPELPLLDFATMRTSATLSNTLNYYTTSGSAGAGKCLGWTNHGSCNTFSGSNTWAGDHVGRDHFFDANHHASSKSNTVWYWDGNLTLTGHYNTAGGTNDHRIGIYGTVIVRGNLVIDAGDTYSFNNGPVPPQAWKEYKRLKTSQYDTATDDEYPADNGFQTNRLTFNHGSESWTGGPPSANTDVGIRGLLYVGGNLTIQSNARADIAGVVWVVGNVTNNNTSERSLVFYDRTINVPVLNVVLNKLSWREVSPSSTAWQP